MSVVNASAPDPFVSSFLRYVEEETKLQSDKILEKYQKIMTDELEAARLRIVASAGVRLSSMISVQDMGRVIKLEITKS